MELCFIMLLSCFGCLLVAKILGIVFYSCGNGKLPPGPPKFPVFGFMPVLAFNPQKVLRILGQIYGSIYTIYIGNYRVVVLNDLQAIKEAFKEDVFSGRPDLKMLSVRNKGVRLGLVCSEGRTWQDQRKFTFKQLKDFGYGKISMEALIEEEVDELLHGIRKDLGKPIDLEKRFNMVVLNALWRITSGHRYAHDDINLQKLLQSTGADLSETQYTGPLLFLPWLIKYFPQLTRWESFVSSVDSVFDFLKQIVKSHKETLEPGKVRDFIDSYLLEIQKTTDPTSSFFGNAGEHSLLIVLLDLFMAGADTQKTTLSWGFLYMIFNPKVQSKVQAEIDEVIGDDKVSLAHRILMPYTEATLMEILRKSSLVPMGLFHSTKSDTNFRNFTILKDTVILANLHNVLNDKKYWKNPEIFCPERFLDSTGKKLIKHEAFIPFSIGRRACPGENLAKDQLFLIFVSLLQSFTFVGGQKQILEKARVGVVLSPYPFDVVAIDRRTQHCIQSYNK